MAIESKRNAVDYSGMWKKALAMSPDERALRLQEIITPVSQAAEIGVATASPSSSTLAGL